MAQNPSIISLAKQAVADAVKLGKAQVALAQVELESSKEAAAKTSVFFVLAASMALFGFIFVLITVAYVLVQLGLPMWAAFGIVALALIILAVVMALMGRSEAKKIQPPTLAIEELHKTLDTFAPPNPE